MPEGTVSLPHKFADRLRLELDSVPPQLTDLDRDIWREELDEFVPQDVFDVHTHVYRGESGERSGPVAGPPAAPNDGESLDSDWAALDACDAALMPGRRVRRLCFPFPFPSGTDLQAANRFVAEQVRLDPESRALMLVHPSMAERDLEQLIARHGFVGLKPYRFFSRTGDTVDCRIDDFLPAHHVRVADRHGLIVMLHLARRHAVADPLNLEDLRKLSGDYPRAKWVLAHCARSYSAWAIERAAAALRGLPNVWYDTSSVCESDAIEALCSAVGVERVMYGSDDLPVGVQRGKYIAFGRAWAFLSEKNHRLDLSHCDGRMTFTRYEQLRAMRRAAARLNLSRTQIEDLFFHTAAKLVASV